MAVDDANAILFELSAEFTVMGKTMGKQVGTTVATEAELKDKVASLQAKCADCCDEYALRTGGGFKEYERRREELNEAQRNLDALLRTNSKEKQ